jgi:hypothetical protein
MKSDCHISLGWLASNRRYDDRGRFLGSATISPAAVKIRLIVAGAGARTPSCCRCQEIVTGSASSPWAISSARSAITRARTTSPGGQRIGLRAPGPRLQRSQAPLSIAG